MPVPHPVLWSVLHLLAGVVSLQSLLSGSLLAQNPAPDVPVAEVDHVQPSTNPVEQDLATLKQLMAADQGQQINQQLTNLGRKYLPEVYTDTKKWGKQKEFSTLFPREKPLVLNHGTWKKYEVRPIEPESRFHIRIDNLRNESGTLKFTLQCDARLEMDARQAKWVRGVQLYSVNAVAEADLSLSLDCEIHVGFDWSETPAMVIDPKVVKSDVEIHEFRIHRVSKVGGEVAQQITRAARDWLDDHEVRNEEKLVEKINKQIEKKRDRLRIPLT